MGILFFIPLSVIAFYESMFDTRKHTWMNNWFRGNDEGEADSPTNRNPIVDDPQCHGLVISRVPFEELIQVFPNTAQVWTTYFGDILLTTVSCSSHQRPVF